MSADTGDTDHAAELGKLSDIPPGIWRLLAAAACTAMATSMQATVVGLQVFEITDRELFLGFIGIAEFLPVLLLSPFTGTLADRFDRRVVFRVGLAIDTAAALGLLLYATTNPTSAVPMLALVSLGGIGRAVSWPSARALPIDLAPDGLLERIVAVRSLGFQISLIVGPLVGAFANRSSTVLPYAIAAALFASGFVLIAGVPNPGTEKLTSGAGAGQAIRDARAGVRYLFKAPILLGAISLDLFAVLFGGAVALLPAIVERRLEFDDVDLGVGILRASIAAAAALTALLLSLRPLSRRVGPSLFGVVAIFGLGTIALGLSRSLWFAIAAVATLSAADQVSVFIRSSVVPLATPENMRGRVLAVENVFIGGSNELGAFESGATAALFGLAPAVVLGGVGTLVVVAVGWFVFPELRSLDRFSDAIPAAADR